MSKNGIQAKSVWGKREQETGLVRQVPDQYTQPYLPLSEDLTTAVKPAKLPQPTTELQQTTKTANELQYSLQRELIKLCTFCIILYSSHSSVKFWSMVKSSVQIKVQYIYTSYITTLRLNCTVWNSCDLKKSIHTFPYNAKGTYTSNVFQTIFCVSQSAIVLCCIIHTGIYFAQLDVIQMKWRSFASVSQQGKRKIHHVMYSAL